MRFMSFFAKNYRLFKQNECIRKFPSVQHVMSAHRRHRSSYLDHLKQSIIVNYAITVYIAINLPSFTGQELRRLQNEPRKPHNNEHNKIIKILLTALFRASPVPLVPYRYNLSARIIGLLKCLIQPEM